MKKWFTCLLVIIGLFSGYLKSESVGKPIDDLKSGQLIVVLTDDWNSTRARLYCFEKAGGKWIMQFSFPAVVGAKGMAIGDGLRNIPVVDAPLKKEGDQKSPAGIFQVGPAFGYADRNQAAWIRLSYVCATDTVICVDDTDSRFYNRLIKKDSVVTDWHSHEEMHRKDKDYKWGIFVQHNMYPTKQGDGSCIFLHIWENADSGTAGCTAMEEKNLFMLLHWIQGKKNPILVQFPESAYKKIIPVYDLPDL